MTDLLDKIERIEVATIQPADVLFIHLPAGAAQEDVDRIKERFVEITGLTNRCIAMSAGIEIEIKRPASTPASLDHG